MANNEFSAKYARLLILIKSLSCFLFLSFYIIFLHLPKYSINVTMNFPKSFLWRSMQILIYMLLKLMYLFDCNLQLGETVHHRATIAESAYLKWTDLQNVSKICDPWLPWDLNLTRVLAISCCRATGPTQTCDFISSTCCQIPT